MWRIRFIVYAFFLTHARHIGVLHASHVLACSHWRQVQCTSVGLLDTCPRSIHYSRVHACFPTCQIKSIRIIPRFGPCACGALLFRFSKLSFTCISPVQRNGMETKTQSTSFHNESFHFLLFLPLSLTHPLLQLSTQDMS